MLFIPAVLLGIFAGYRYAPLLEEEIIKPDSFSWDNVLILLIFFLVFSLVFIKFKKIASVLLKFFLLLVVLSGSQIIFGSFLSSPWDLVSAVLLISIFIFLKNVLSHNLGMIFGIAGAGTLLGLNLGPTNVIILLVVLSFYDIAAVYWTKHMVALARGMVESGAIFGFIIPFDFKDFFHHSGEARQKIGEKFMILGSGDIGLPIVMASSVAVISVNQALIVGFFSILGLFLTHLIFVNQTTRRPMAALPPIATLTIIGYLIASLN